MTPFDKEALVDLISGSQEIDQKMKSWFLDHCIDPREIKIQEINSPMQKIDLLLITDHSGTNDSSYRIVFSKTENMFGLDMITDKGEAVFLGFYGSLQDTLEAM